MKTDIESHHLVVCLNLIEEKLNRGPSAEWTGYDFEQLSIYIQEETGTLLSITTLKRIWGKIQYNSLPTINTLNTLAKFAGYTDWNSFNRQIDKESIIPTKPSFSSNDIVKTHLPRKLKYAFGILLVILITFLFIFSQSKKDQANVDETAFQFSSLKILSQGVPNSVIFNYNAQKAETDEVYIAQSWDTTRKTKSIILTLYQCGKNLAKANESYPIKIANNFAVNSDNVTIQLY